MFILLLFWKAQVWKNVTKHYVIKMHIRCSSYLLHIWSIVPITSWVDKNIKLFLQRICCHSKEHATSAKITIPKIPQNASKWFSSSGLYVDKLDILTTSTTIHFISFFKIILSFSVHVNYHSRCLLCAVWVS